MRVPCDPVLIRRLRAAASGWASRNGCEITVSFEGSTAVLTRDPAYAHEALEAEPTSLTEAVARIVPTSAIDCRVLDVRQGHCPFCRAPGESLVIDRNHWECGACQRSGDGPQSWQEAVKLAGVSATRAGGDAPKHRAMALDARMIRKRRERDALKRQGKDAASGQGQDEEEGGTGGPGEGG